MVYNKTTNKLSIIGGSLDVAGANSSFHNQLELDNDTALYFGGGIGNGTGLKTGSDGTFLFDTGTNQVIKFKGTTGGGTTFGYTDGVFNYVWRSNSYGATTQSWGATINTTAADSDTQIQGVTDPNLVFVDASTDRVGIGTNAPSTKLDVNSDRIRIRTSKTPLSAVDTGTTGDMCWDANFFYLCVATNTWKRSTLATW